MRLRDKPAACRGLAHGDAHVFGDAATYSACGAALINATLGPSLDCDDTHAEAVVHPGAPIILGDARADRLAEDVLQLDSLKDGASILCLTPSTTQRAA